MKPVLMNYINECSAFYFPLLCVCFICLSLKSGIKIKEISMCVTRRL